MKFLYFLCFFCSLTYVSASFSLINPFKSASLVQAFSQQKSVRGIESVEASSVKAPFKKLYVSSHTSQLVFSSVLVLGFV